MARSKRTPRSGAPAGERLAAGRDGLERVQVIEIQRARMLAAMVEVVLERGVANVTVAHVVQRAGVSRRTYYELFADREECFLAALEDGLARIAAIVMPAYEGKGPVRLARTWRERIRVALIELLGLFDEDPGLGRLVVVESLAAGPRALARRNMVLDRLIAVVYEGRALTAAPKGHMPATSRTRGGQAAAGAWGGAGSGPPALTAEGVVGAVSSILYARLAAGAAPVTGGLPRGEDQRPLIELTGPLMSLIVLPYLGKAAAARELARPVPAARVGASQGGAGYPFRDLGMRLTYRTLRVLEAVARNSDGSNRLIGETAGIADQGQISKLLARLQRLGLIENTAGASGKGAPNAWRLTEKGQSMQRAIDTPRGGAGP
jgi:AcrR family transcriptional regulator